jgi:ArsR family transcriptional regulator, virulence genes transcriptional regulator
METLKMPQAIRRAPAPSAKIRPVRNGIADLELKAAEAAQLLKLLANENRLLILCRLVLAREMSVNDLAAAVGLSQSALSQHLAKMREEGLVDTRREAQTVFYRIANPNAARLLALLKNIYCP